MNKVFLIGRLVETPTIRQTQTGKTVVPFTIAVNRMYDREKVDFIDIVTFGGLADNCGRYLSKGQQVAVVGELQTRSYETKDGSKRKAFEVKADDVTFLAKSSGKITEEEPDNELVLVEDGELPF